MNLKLASVKPGVGDVKTFIFHAEQPLTWIPGQYMHYTIPGSDQDGQANDRWFTISAAPSEGHPCISTRLFPAPSHFKQALAAMQVGDEIEADGPDGDFVLDEDDKSYLFIAGGIGITPFRSMLVEAARTGQPLKAHLLYANSSSNIAFKDELDAALAKLPGVKIDYITSPQRIDEDILKSALASISSPAIYLSGPDPFVAAMNGLLVGLGVNEAAIKRDYFSGYRAE